MSLNVWTSILLGIVSVLYLGTAIAYQFSGRSGMAIAFIGYVIANCGLIWDALYK